MFQEHGVLLLEAALYASMTGPVPGALLVEVTLLSALTGRKKSLACRSCSGALHVHQLDYIMRVPRLLALLVGAPCTW
jgi:hypothetical protein